MKFFNYNGRFFEEGTPIIGADSRALRYGDGIFETIKYKNKECILLNDHLERLWTGLNLMQFDKPKLFTKQYLRDEIAELVKKNRDMDARIRLTLFRANGGLYDAAHHQPQFIIQSMPLNTATDTLNSNGLQLCIYRDALKSCDAFSNIKHNNYLPYLMGALFAKTNRCNDALILNNHLRICDSTIANIFIIKNEIIYTPTLAEGSVAGIMRKFLLTEIPTIGFEIKETVLTEEILMEADEVFLSNSIYNIRWVADIAQKKYNNTVTKKIFDSLSQTNKAIFC
jgi:branched-chain amino acid aminotransferase